MKFLWVVMVLGVPALLTGQEAYFRPDSIPVKNGQIVFEANFDYELSQSEYNARINQFLSKQLNPVSGEITEKNTDYTTCKVVDYLSVGDNFFHSFGIYMIYYLRLSAADGHSRLRIDRISYLEKGYIDAYLDPSENRNLPRYTAEEIMLEEQFKQLFVKDASKRTTEQSFERINGIVEDLHAIYKVAQN